jgi:uncharacterized membrane protein YraQ (UPF0718 family)
MEWRREWKPFAIITAVFLVLYYLPLNSAKLNRVVMEALQLTAWYAREHVILCLVPAFFVAGAIAVFVSQASVIKYFGAKANRVLSYGVASVSGTILAVCSCTVLPLFAGIYRMGAGLGPATTFLYSGPAVNVLAIILTARVLGLELGIARGIGAILFSIVVGLLMHLIFRREEIEKADAEAVIPQVTAIRPLWKNALYFALMIAVLVFANWGRPADGLGFWSAVYSARWVLTGISAAALGLILTAWFGFGWARLAAVAAAPMLLALLLPARPALAFAAGFIGLSIAASRDSGEPRDWIEQTWGFAKQILPLLFIGVLIAGALLGRPGHEALIPPRWVAGAVGGSSLLSNFVASVAGAFMYFATLTEVPILQGLIGSGMGKGPALALLLAGPALSLPNMLVIRSVIGTKKLVAFVTLVVVMSTVCGIIYGNI